ncbi:MAG: sugar phosphate isomerase/epimerase [Puia sp.]|nr:sugar phosphate isomerase/epimerase [Puia sp.]
MLSASAGAYLLPLKSRSTTPVHQQTSTTRVIPTPSVPGPASPADFTFCLNMATLRGHNLGFIKELETASRAGFRSVEIWIDSLQHFIDGGGTPSQASQHLQDLGITVENAIGFAEWIPDDEAARKKGLAQLQREMDMLARIGCKRIAAPPTGATHTGKLDLRVVAERYRGILELGDQSGVVPQLEMWGFSNNLSRVSDVLYAAMESGHASARVLLDIFHIYKGGSSVETLPLMGKTAVGILHMNDYTEKFTSAAITDADRVHPGDGIAPIKRILSILRTPDRSLILSEEVFNPAYYRQDALVVAKTALAKMKALTESMG